MIIDRFEGDFAVAETENGMTDILRSHLPENAEEGDVIYFENGVYIIDEKATADRRKLITERFHRLMRYRND
ncbi:MAG: DUF3006 domain-containing protein [Ruminococcus sp.]|nr:DUF3006 domain-containing protein [Ruminococcus sp.]